jgi:hypothetical protein
MKATFRLYHIGLSQWLDDITRRPLMRSIDVSSSHTRFKGGVHLGASAD